MNTKVWIKSRLADRALTPLRNEILDLIDSHSSVLEIGCGTGDLLFKAEDKISNGLGVDLDDRMIAYAENERLKKGISHIQFACTNALALPASKYDIATSTLCLHEMDEKDACALLKMMVESSSVVLIADYSKPSAFLGKLSIEIDEMLSGHYQKFKHYRKAGGIPAYVMKIGASLNSVVNSSIDGISIWVIDGNR